MNYLFYDCSRKLFFQHKFLFLSSANPCSEISPISGWTSRQRADSTPAGSLPEVLATPSRGRASGRRRGKVRGRESPQFQIRGLNEANEIIAPRTRYEGIYFCYFIFLFLWLSRFAGLYLDAIYRLSKYV